MTQTTANESIDKITEIVKQVLETEVDLQPEEALSQYGMDSLKSVALIVDLEELFDILFDDVDLVYDNFATISKIAKMVEQKQHV